MPRNHVLLVPAIHGNPRNLLVAARHEIAASARFAYEAVPAMPSHSHPVALLPFHNLRPNGINHARNFMPRHSWKRQARPQPILRQMVAVADTTRLHFDSHFANSGLRDFTFH